MATKLHLILYHLNTQGTVVEDMINHYRDGSRYDLKIYQLKNVSEFESLAKIIPNGMILFCIYDPESLTSVVNLLKAIKPLLKKNYFKIAGFNDLENPKVEELLSKSGVTEIIDPDINLKTIRYKIDVWQKSLKSHKIKTFNLAGVGTKSQASEPPTEIVIENQNAFNNDVGQNKSDDVNQTLLEKGPLDLAEDFWILENKDDCKHIIKKWVIRLLGPGPNVAKWEKVATPNSSKPMWRFDPKDPLNPHLSFFLNDGGAWYFYGPKPEFDWKLRGWIFTGDSPNLFFHKGSSRYEKFSLTFDGLTIAKNSSQGLLKEHEIISTILASESERTHLSENAPSTPPASGENISTHYEGKIAEAEKAIDGHLEGEVDGTTDHTTKPLSGNIKTEIIDGNPLTGESAKETNQATSWKGSLKNDEIKENKEVKKKVVYNGPKYKGALSGKSSKTKNEEQNKNKEKEEAIPSLDFHDQPTLDGPDLDQHKKLIQKTIPAPEKIDQLLDEFLEDISIESGELKVIIQYHRSEMVQEEEIECKLFDMFDGELVLKTITNDNLELKKVKLALIFEYEKKENKIEYHGDITDVSPTPDEQFYITIKLEEFDQSIFDKFLEQYQARQENVSKFLDRVKGTG